MQCLLLSFFKKGSISSPQPPNPHPLLKKPKKACNMESFATIVNGFQVLTIVVKFSILYIWGVPGYVSEGGVHLIFNSFTGPSTRPATLLKKRLWHMCFPVNFPKFLETPFLTEHLRWMLLKNYLVQSLLKIGLINGNQRTLLASRLCKTFVSRIGFMYKEILNYPNKLYG